MVFLKKLIKSQKNDSDVAVACHASDVLGVAGVTNGVAVVTNDVAVVTVVNNQFLNKDYIALTSVNI